MLLGISPSLELGSRDLTLLEIGILGPQDLPFQGPTNRTWQGSQALKVISGELLNLNFTIYTGGINSSFMKSYFAWPSCVYPIKKQIKIWSYMKHL